MAAFEEKIEAIPTEIINEEKQQENPNGMPE